MISACYALRDGLNALVEFLQVNYMSPVSRWTYFIRIEHIEQHPGHGRRPLI